MYLIYIMLGGAIGALGRYTALTISAKIFGLSFPYGTIIVNVLGSLMMGIIVALSVHHITSSPQIKYGIIIGFLGAFTTFSTFSLDSITLYERGEIFLSAAYICISVITSLLAFFLGLYIVRSI